LLLLHLFSFSSSSSSNSLLPATTPSPLSLLLLRRSRLLLEISATASSVPRYKQALGELHRRYEVRAREVCEVQDVKKVGEFVIGDE